MHFRLPQKKTRRSIALNLALLIALILNLFPTFVPGGEMPTASAHNLNSSVVYAFFDPTTQKLLDDRIAGGWTPGTPLLQPNDELGIVIKTVPDSGTTTGVGGYTTFYVPNGVQVVDAAFIMPGDFINDGILGWDKVPTKGQAQMPIVGAGGESTVSLVGVTRGPNVLGVTSPIVRADNTNLGTLPGVYGDTGIFYSTAPETAFGSYTGAAQSIKNNSGDTVGLRTLLQKPLNLWDAWQMAGYGIAGTTNSAYPSAALLDANQRGYAPWGLANVVAGPQSGYAWEFDFAKYTTCDPTPTGTPLANCLDFATQDIGPWQRIQYSGSQFADDPPGGTLTLPQPYTRGADASESGFALSPANPLPLTTGQSNGTPNAIRWAFGQLTYLTPEYAWVKVKIDNPAGIVDPTGCPRMYIDTFGGDAGGESGGKDHMWRYYDPNSVIFNGCLAVGKPATRELVKVGENFQYKIKVYNLANFAYSNVTVKDTLPSGVTFLSAIPAQDSGPNPLQWNNIGALVGDQDGSFEPGEMFEATVTVKASSSGVLFNQLSVTGTPPNGPTEEVVTGEGTIGGGLPLLRTLKSVTPTAVAPGGQVEYTIEVKNVGSGPTGSPVAITEFLPAGFTYVGPLVSAVMNGANVTGSTTVNATNPAQPIFTVPGSINAGNEMLLTFKAQVGTNVVAGNYCNSYRLTQNGINQLTGSLACVDVGAGTIGDTVFRDWSGDGTQDTGEEGLAGITVNLYAGACPPSGSPLQSQVTDANGNYLFAGLLSPASYCVDPVSPAGYTLTTAADPLTVSLAQNETNLNADFGYQPGGAGTIGDQLFEDVNNNGVEGAAEPPIIAEVTVRLYEDTNGNGVIDAGDLQIATTTTNPGDGTYSFTGLDPNLFYIVQVDETDPDLAAYFAPDAFVNTTGALQAVSPTDFADSSNNYVDADFGYFRLLPSSIGDEVCIDSNNDGSCAGETLLPGVTVNLYLDGNLIATTSTSITGTYSFTGLGPGDYTVEVDATDPNIPGGYFPTVNDIFVSLGVGVDIDTVDFPFVQLISKEVSAAKANPGDTLTYTITANYPGNELLSDVIVTDTIPAGTTYVPASANAGGVYSATTNTITWALGSNTEGAPAYAGSAAGTNSFQAVQDTKLQINNETNNYGNETTIQLRTSKLEERRALVRFNVTSLNAQTVSGADLRFYVSNTGSANTRIDVYPLTRAWDSTGTNWTKATAATNWTKAGGDYDAGNLLGSFVPTTNNQYYTVSGAAVNALVQSWIDNSAANFGVILIMSGEVDEVEIRPVEDTNAPSRKPELQVTTGAGTTTLNPSQDTFVDQNSPTAINATANPLRVRNSPDEQRGLLQWDLSSLPPGAEVVDASVKLYFTSGNSEVTVRLYQGDKVWNEASATWMLAQTGDPWAIPGGDFSTALGSFVAPGTNNTYRSFSSSALEALVQGWIDGSINNRGILLLPTSVGTGKAATFASSENSNQLLRPELIVTYLSDVITQTVQTKIPVGPAGGQDTYIDVDNEGNNFGDETTFRVETPSASEARALLRFDLSSLTGQTVNSATLRVTVNNATANGRVEVYPLTRSFIETQASWNNADTGTAWTTAGGDYDSTTLIGTFSPTANGVYDITGPALNTLIQSWINSGATNYGLIFVMKGIADDAQMRTKEQGAPDQPTLIVTTGSGTTNLISVADTELRQSNPTNNYGTASSMAVVRPAGENRGLVQWDLSAYEPDVLVTAATIRFNVSSLNANMLVSLHQALQSWTEGTGSNGSDADWLRHDTGQTWATPGGDFSSTVLGSFTPSATGWVEISNPAVIALVQGWLDGSIDNNGIFLTGSGQPGQQASFHSVGTVDNVLSPQLVFTFNTNSRETELFAGPSLVSDGGTIQVSMELSATQTITDVTPSILIAGTNGVTAICGSPIPTPPVDVVVGSVRTFSWTCTAEANGNIGELIFSGNATGAVGSVFGLSDANSVLVAPPLTFQAVVDNPSTVDPVVNTAYIKDASFIPLTASDPVETVLGASIGDRVWIDLDGDGVQDVGEPGLQGVTVIVTGPNCAPCTATTNANGNYLVAGLVAGSYTVTYDAGTIPADYTPSTSTSVAVVLSTGQQFQDADFGLQPPGAGSIGDRIWLDADNDSIQDSGENGLPGITVTLEKLVNGNWVTLATQMTDADGLYNFDALRAGDYRVIVDTTSVVTSTLDATVTSTIGASMIPTYDLDGIGTPHIAPVALATDSTTIDTVDFGYNWGGSIGDYVWYDNNRNQLQDESPVTPIFNAEVRLYYDDNNNGVVDPMEYFDRAATLHTDANGAYLFQNLPPGNYLVDVYEDSITTDGVRDVVPTTPDIHTIYLNPNEARLDADFGYYIGALVRGYVFWDEDRNGVFDGSENGLSPVTVFLTPEPGVDLGNGPGQPISTLTDGDGFFLFPVPVGTYTLTYSSPTVLTIDPTLGDTTTPVSYAFEAQPGEDWSVIFYFGVDNTGKIGDTVWNDADSSGVQDSGEAGLADVTVTLYKDNNNNSVYDSGDTFVAADITDATGQYLFEGAPDGNYIVVVDGSTLPIDFGQTYDNVGSLDDTGQADITGGSAVLTVDFGYKYDPIGGAALYNLSGRVYNDLNNNSNDDSEPAFPGVDVTVICTILGTVTVQTNANGEWVLAGVPDGDVCTVNADANDLPRNDFTATETPSTPITVNGSNITGLDFGYRQQPGSISGTVCNSATGLLGVGPCDDGSDTPLPSVTVSLIYAGDDGILGTADDTVAVDTTDTNGAYSFPNLEPGVYVIVQTDLPGYTSLGDRDGGNANVISPVNLALGQNITSRNFEDYIPLPSTISGTVWEDLNGDGVWQAGEPPISGVLISLSNGLTTTTNASGLYTFTVNTGGLYTITETNPTGFMSTGDVDGGNPDQISVTVNNGDIITGQDFLDMLMQPDYTVTKTLNTPSPVRRYETISFTIRITNTGNVTITTLPLNDAYSNFFMTYVGSTPVSDDNVDDGSINWSDLTAAAPGGFGQDLAPNASLAVVVEFIAKADTTPLPDQETINNVTISGARYDPDGSGGVPEQGPLPSKSANDGVGILSPTSVLLADYGLDAGESRVDIHWQTVDESNIAQFELYRVENGVSTRLATLEAEKPGQPVGFRYTYADSDVSTQVWYEYHLDVLQLDGSVTTMPLGNIYTGGSRLFLPSVTR
jgi:uncharacterized repeat protein (TIGR01451 family)